MSDTFSAEGGPFRGARASPEPEVTPSQDYSAGKMDFSTILHIIATEIDVEPEMLTDDTVLKDLGIDSIIQISTVARLQEHVERTLPSGLLMQYNTVAKLRKYVS